MRQTIEKQHHSHTREAKIDRAELMLTTEGRRRLAVHDLLIEAVRSRQTKAAFAGRE